MRFAIAVSAIVAASAIQIQSESAALNSFNPFSKSALAGLHAIRKPHTPSPHFMTGMLTDKQRMEHMLRYYINKAQLAQ